MIAKVVRGWRPGGLLAYLFGPGRHEEHRNPRVVASWDGVPGLHQPARLADVVVDGERLAAGEFDLDLRLLIATMTGPAKVAGLPTSGPPQLPPEWAALARAGTPRPVRGRDWSRWYRYDARRDAVATRPGWVWHCSVRLHPDDPTLPDEQWEQIAQRLMRATGIDQAGCRWIAVRHADDHIHLVATLVSERTGRRFHPYRDYFALRTECRRLETELGLTPTAPADKTALPAPTRAELAKAQRLGRPRTAREDLRRQVEHAAAVSRDSAEFLTALDRDGLDPKVSRDGTGRACGYTVSLPGDRTVAGEPVRFAGAALATDLTWPRLAQRWTELPPTQPLPTTASGRVRFSTRTEILTRLTATARRATSAVRAGDGDPDGVAHAVGEVLTVLGHADDGRAAIELTVAADRYDRAARTPHRVVPVPLGPLARDLRVAARQLGTIGTASGRQHPALASTALLLAIGSLVLEIAACQHPDRPHQAAAARAAAVHLQQLSPGAPRTPAKPPASIAASRAQPLPQHGARPTTRPPRRR